MLSMFIFIIVPATSAQLYGGTVIADLNYQGWRDLSAEDLSPGPSDDAGWRNRRAYTDDPFTALIVSPLTFRLLA